MENSISSEFHFSDLLLALYPIFSLCIDEILGSQWESSARSIWRRLCWQSVEKVLVCFPELEEISTSRHFVEIVSAMWHLLNAQIYQPGPPTWRARPPSPTATLIELMALLIFAASTNNSTQFKYCKYYNNNGKLPAITLLKTKQLILY